MSTTTPPTTNRLPTPSNSPTQTDIEEGDHPLFKKEEEEVEDGSPSLHPVQSRIQEPNSLPREILFIALICSAQLTTQAALGQSIAPLHIIGDTLSITSAGRLSWIPAAYSLSVGTFILIAGRLGDLYGHKLFFISGYVWLGLWSLVAGFARMVQDAGSNGEIFFDVCRAMQGIGPAFMLPNAIAILGRTYPPGARKSMVFSLFGATAPSGFAVGAVFSSLFAQTVGWEWSFWIMAIFCILCAAAAYFIIPHTPTPGVPKDSHISSWSRIDGWGSLTGITALILINFAWNQGPVVGWPTAYCYVLLIIGFLFLAVFGFIEYHTPFPLLPRTALSSDTAFVLGCIAAGWASFGIWVYYLWQFFEELRHASPLLTSAYFTPATISGLAAALTTGVILHKVPPSVVMMISMLAFTVGTILIATAPIHQSYWAQTFVSIIVMPWGMDMSFPAATILLSNRLKKEEQGVAASLVVTIVNYSISIGLGMAGTIDGQVGGEGEDGVLRGYRGGLYFGIGLGGLGVLIATAFGLNHYMKAKRGGVVKRDGH